MRHKVADLEGEMLDTAVNVAEWKRKTDGRWVGEPRAYSTEWKHGGPIIERERISVQFVQPSAEWEADADYVALNHGLGWTGQTPLIAAMRAYVASKFGEEIEL